MPINSHFLTSILQIPLKSQNAKCDMYIFELRQKNITCFLNSFIAICLILVTGSFGNMIYWKWGSFGQNCPFIPHPLTSNHMFILQKGWAGGGEDFKKHNCCHDKVVVFRFRIPPKSKVMWKKKEKVSFGPEQKQVLRKIF